MLRACCGGFAIGKLIVEGTLDANEVRKNKEFPLIN
jgi:hypothetical protein